MCNQDLRNEIKSARIYQWEVAEHIGVSEVTLVRWLRKELPADKKKLIQDAISDLKKAVKT